MGKKKVVAKELGPKMVTVISERNTPIYDQTVHVGDILELPEPLAEKLVELGDVRLYGKAAPGGSEDKAMRPVVANKNAKKVAKKLGVDLSLVEGTGQGGRITKADVKKFAESVS